MTKPPNTLRRKHYAASRRNRTSLTPCVLNARNPGGFLSLGENLAPQLRFWVFVVFNVLLLTATLVALVAGWKTQLFKFVALVLILAGGVGNLIDRVIHDGLVTDFANLGVGPVRTGIFNVADVALTVGALVLLIACRGKASAQQEHAC